MSLSISEVMNIQKLLQDMRTEPDGEVVPESDRPRTIAHLLMTIRNELGHVRRHTDAALNPDSSTSRIFNIEHASRHTDNAIEHNDKLLHSIGMYDNAVGDEIEKLKQALGEEM